MPPALRRLHCAIAATGAFLGRPADEVVGRTDQELFPAESARLIRCNDLAIIRSGRPFTYEEVLAMPTGEERTFLAMKFPYHVDGAIAGLVGISRDITERRHAESAIRAAREAARLKDLFLSSLSHEIKTPLSLIVGYTELLQDRYPDQPELEGILDGTRRLMRHIDDLLTYSALVGGAFSLYRTEACLPEILRDAAALVEPEARAKRQHLDLRVDADGACLEGDTRRLVQVIGILLENAVRFTPAGGDIAVSLLARADDVEISVQDSGIGMSTEDLRRIWEPFGQARAGDADRSGGLGLGLKIARRLVELHGGSLTLLSSPGQGTRATVVLPLRPPAGAARPETADAAGAAPR